MRTIYRIAVLATTKVPNLKANHNLLMDVLLRVKAVLATTKVPNLKANHNKSTLLIVVLMLY